MTRATEQTPEGTQTLIDGVTPITQAERLQAAQNKPLTFRSAPMDKGLFDLNARNQADLF